MSAVGVVSQLPLSGCDARTGIDIEGREASSQEPTRAHWRFVISDYFRAMGIQLLEGRLLTEQDAQENAPPVVVINRTMAATYWPGQSPIGKRLRVNGAQEWFTIIGVVRDVNH